MIYFLISCFIDTIRNQICSVEQNFTDATDKLATAKKVLANKLDQKNTAEVEFSDLSALFKVAKLKSKDAEEGDRNIPIALSLYSIH